MLAADVVHVDMLARGAKQAMDEEESRIFGVDPVRMAQYRNGSRDEVLRTPEHVREHMFANTEHFVFHVIDEAATVIQSIVRQRIATKTVQFKREQEEAKMFIQANLKHAYTFNSIRGAEDL